MYWLPSRRFRRALAGVGPGRSRIPGLGSGSQPGKGCDIAGAGDRDDRRGHPRPEILRQAVAGVETVYHLAAVFRRAGVPDSEYREVHVDATRDLVKAMRRPRYAG